MLRHITYILALSLSIQSSFAVPVTTINRTIPPGQSFQYSCAETSVFIPWSNAKTNPNFVDEPRLSIQIDKYKGTVVIDTGSTALTIAVKYLNGYTTNVPGWKYLSSSQLLYQGYWTKKDLKLGDNVVSTLEVLAVHTTLHCPGHTNDDGYNCRNVTATYTDPSVVYLGIGYGRRDDGMTECTPDRNPALNIATINGVAVDPKKFNRGYTVDKTGLTLGLTTTTATGYAFASLGPSGSLPVVPMDWSMAPACITIGGPGAPCLQGNVLPDTGIPNMFLRHPNAPDLKNGVRLSITIPGNGFATIAQYSFIKGDVGDGDKGGVVPSTVSAHNVNETVFVNTGRYVFNAYKFAYDHEHGAFGVQVLPGH